MTDSQWSDDAPAIKKKKGLPGWLWFCGAGCLVLVIVAIIAGFFVSKAVKSGLDPDQQWPKLQEELAFDERPSNVSLKFGANLFGYQFFVLEGEGLAGILMKFGRAQRKEVDQMMDPDFTGGAFGVGGREDTELETMMIQGREVTALHFYQATPGQDQKTGQGIVLDLSEERDDNPLFLQLVRVLSRDKITQEEVEAFLSGFNL